jgi:hypothetical protein
MFGLLTDERGNVRRISLAVERIIDRGRLPMKLKLDTVAKVGYRIIGVYLLVSLALLAHTLPAITKYFSRGAAFAAASTCILLGFVSVLIGGVGLVLQRRWSPYVIYAATVWSIFPGAAFSYLPFIHYYFPRDISIWVGNSITIGALILFQCIRRRARKRTAANHALQPTANAT